MQISYASSSGVGEIFRAHQRFAAKSGKHQAHQFGTRRLNGETRGEGGSSVEVVDAARFAVGLK